MTRMEAEREADRRNSDKTLKREGFWVASRGKEATLLAGWSVSCIRNGATVRAVGLG